MKRVIYIVILLATFGMFSACGKEKENIGQETSKGEVKGNEIEQQKQENNSGIGTESTLDIDEEADAKENTCGGEDIAEESFDWSTFSIADENDFEWKEVGAVDANEISITGYQGSEMNLKVPGKIDGKTVVSISAYAFEEQTGLINIDLTETSLSHIEEKAFYQCSNLQRMALPDMPVNSIEVNPFLHCNSLFEIILGEGSELEMEDGMIYSGTNLILRIPAFADTDVVIREGTTSIEHAAFLGSNAVSVFMPDSVEYVDRMIFNRCVNLESVTLSSNLKWVSQYMFEYCRNLKEIIIPEGVEGISGDAFWWCSSLEHVEFPSTLTQIGEYAFCGCGRLTNISIPASVTTIGDKAFSDCNSLTDVYYGGNEQDWYMALGVDVFKSMDNDSGVISVVVHYNN